MVPNFQHLRTARGDDTYLGVIVTAAGAGRDGGAGGDGDFDIVSRYFAPWLGIDEDPVTGSAHCALAPYWSRILGRSELRACQASKRGGSMVVRLNGNRVELVGDSVIVASGVLRSSTDVHGLTNPRYGASKRGPLDSSCC